MTGKKKAEKKKSRKIGGGVREREILCTNSM
jgi:hypothetical protein